MQKINFKYLGIFILAMFLSACPDEVKFQEQNDKAFVSFSVSDNNSRTVFPQVTLSDVKSYKLFGGKDGVTGTELLEFTTGTASLTLDTGIWNFTLNAYNANDAIFYKAKL